MSHLIVSIVFYLRALSFSLRCTSKEEFVIVVTLVSLVTFRNHQPSNHREIASLFFFFPTSCERDSRGIKVYLPGHSFSLSVFWTWRSPGKCQFVTVLTSRGFSPFSVGHLLSHGYICSKNRFATYLRP